jgi:hypothetical protein
MSTKVKELSPQQQQAALLMAEGKTGRQVAEALAVAEETVSRWKQQTEFEALINTCLAEAREATRYRLRTLAGKAINVIDGVLDDDKAEDKDRLSAAFQLLKLIEVTVLFKTGTPIGPVEPSGVEAKRASDSFAASLEYL